MAKFVILGGKKLSGTISVNSAKNSALALICASLLIKNKTVLKDVPRIEEVNRLLEVLQSIGVRCNWQGENTLQIDATKDLNLNGMDKKACEKIRSSLLLLGALAARSGKEYKLYKTGGCKLGKRTVWPHLQALQKFGINIISFEKYYLVKKDKLKAADIVMDESGDTPTENAIMAAVLTSGVTSIRFASSNYMVQDLCHFLQKAGAKIEGVGTTSLTITGVKELKPVVEYFVMPDPIEAMAWISLAITTKSKLSISNCPIDFLELELEKLSAMGQKFEFGKRRLSKNKQFGIVNITVVPSALKALPNKIYGRPYPGLNIDNLPFFIPILTQAKGETMVHDWVYENRAIYYLAFNKLGARVTLLDPHRAIVKGPTKLRGAKLVSPDAIRPAMALLVGMIAASGKSVLKDIYMIERGYESLESRLQAIGVNIKRVD